MPNSGCRCRDAEACNIACTESALFQRVDLIGQLGMSVDDPEKFKRIYLGRIIK